MDLSNTRGKQTPDHPFSRSESTAQAMSEVAEQESTQRSAVVRLDLWQLSVFAVAFIGIFLRWWDLGLRPLQPDEATVALESLSVLRGEGSRSDVSPLILNGGALLMLMFGASDGVVRALPALAGSILVLLPIWLKPELGKTGVLMSMLFLAISPTLIFATRHTTPEALTATAALTVVVCGSHYLRCGNRSAIYIGAVALALMIASGYPSYTYLLVFAGFAVASYLAASKKRRAVRARPDEAKSSEETQDSGGKEADSQGRLLGRAGLLTTAVFAIVATGAFRDLRVIQAGLVGPLSEWLSGFGSANLETTGTQFATVFAYEGAMIVAALVSAAVILRSRNRFDRMLVWWLGAGAMIGIIGGAEQRLALVAGLVPAALLAGWACGRLLDRLGSAGQLTNLIIVALGLLILSVPAYVTITFTSYMSNSAGQRTIALVFLISLVILTIVGLTLSSILQGLGVTWKSFAVVGLVAGLLLTFRLAANLNLHPVANHFELLTPVVTSPDVRRLMYDFGVVVDVLSINRAPRSVQIDSDVGPALRWYMRDQENVSFVNDPSGSPGIYIGDPGGEPPLGGAYVSQRYRIATHGHLRITGPEELVRWLMFREGYTYPTGRDVVLFARTQ